MRYSVCTYRAAELTFSLEANEQDANRTPVRPLHRKGTTMANRFVTTYRAWRKYRQTYNELMQLSNRDLADVGIQRSEIPEIARQAAAEI
jgi:uncharacterized protein YjiS (DUF1127 family)